MAALRFRAETGARLEGGGVAPRPLRTWNGEGLSGEDMRQSPEGEPPRKPREVRAGPLRQVTGWPGRGSGRRSDSGDMEDKTDGTLG